MDSVDTLAVNLTLVDESITLNLNDAGDHIEVIFSEGVSHLEFTELNNRVTALEQSLNTQTADVDATAEATDVTYTYNAYHYTTDTYSSHRYTLATGLLAGIATGAGAIPTDLTTLTYN